MTRKEYMRKLTEAYDAGRISAEAYDAGMQNIDIFCNDDDENDDRFPDSYAEIEYPDIDSAEAYDGMRFDDMNYLHYFER